MFNAMLGGAFGMNDGYFGQQQAMYQQQMQNMYSLAIKGCSHIKPECPICERNREQAIKDAAEKKEAYKKRCSEWVLKLRTKRTEPKL